MRLSFKNSKSFIKNFYFSQPKILNNKKLVMINKDIIEVIFNPTSE